MSELYLQAQEQDGTFDVSFHRVFYTFFYATITNIAISIVTHPVSSMFLSALRAYEEL